MTIFVKHVFFAEVALGDNHGSKEHHTLSRMVLSKYKIEASRFAL